VGTLAGASLTYLFGQLAVRRTERVAHGERFRQELIAAYAGFAEAMTELRRAVISRRFVQQQDPEGPETRTAWTESDKRGAAADYARFKVQLLTDDKDLLRLLDAAFEPIGPLGKAKDLTELKALEHRCEEILTAFIQVVGHRVR
jgi:hypothetical protein